MKKCTLIISLFIFAATLLFAEESAGITLTVKASENNARVLVNAKEMGTAPLEISSLSAGFYIVSVEKKGFYTWRSEIALNDGDSVTLYAQLDRIQGTLIIDCTPKDALIYVDGELYEPPEQKQDTDLVDLLESVIFMNKRVVKVDEGVRTISVRAFGYEEHKQDVIVLRKEFIPLSIELQHAPFTAWGFTDKIARFNPRNPGGLGSVTVSFSVSGPGSAEVHITAPDGQQVATRYLGPFTTWNNFFTWEGSSDLWDRPVLEDGIYTMEFLFEEEPWNDEPPVQLTKTVQVEIDSSVTYQLASPGETGLCAGSVPLALLSPKGSFSLTMDYGINWIPSGNHTLSYPMTVALEAVLPGNNSLTLHDTFYISTGNDSLRTNELTAAVKHLFVNDTIKAGALLRYQWILSPDVIKLNDRSAGLAAECQAGFYSAGTYAGLSAGIIYGNQCGLFSNASLKSKSGAAIRLQKGYFALDGFGALYSKITDGFILNDGAEVGGTLYALAGHSRLILKVGGAVYFRPAEAIQATACAGFTLVD